MLESGGAARLALKAFHFFRRGETPGTLHLERHDAIELDVVRLEDISERTDSQLGLQLEAVEADGTCQQPAGKVAPGICGNLPARPPGPDR